MPTIGIVVITTVGACICANALVAESGSNHPEYVMQAFPFEQYKELVLAKDWPGMARLILQAIAKLKAAGADVIIIPSNTPHYAYEMIQRGTDLPVLNLIELSANACADQGLKKVAVLGTTMTMEDGLYDPHLKDQGITPVIPPKAIRERIQRLIMDEIIPSKINQATVEQVKRDIQSLDCDGVILGCTELPEVYSTATLGMPAIDTTRLLAAAALRYCQEQHDENNDKPRSRL